ncbi:tyrosine-protein phosphatase [Paenibacillus sp. HJGM_3]|uniref:tyrosine-protein phosphatase n=1 Tax=Paenibacillus sp. HJGM_3 TaxID=3379816 RepID=UPI003859474C
MIDIHSHILAGIDDGAKDLEESVEMGRLAHQDGIRYIFATPHFTDTMINDCDTVVRRIGTLQRELDELGIPVRVLPGAEVRLCSYEFVIEYAKRETFSYLVGSRKFVLVEERWTDYESDSLRIMEWFLDREIQPVIAHPERHAFFRKDPALLTALIDAGAWTQVTADSLLGKNNAEAQQFSRWMIERSLVHTLATDAHNVTRRPNLSDGFRMIETWAGLEQVEAIKERMHQFVPPSLTNEHSPSVTA